MGDRKDQHTIGVATVLVDHGYVNRMDASIKISCSGEELILIVKNQCGTDNILIEPKKN